MKNLVCKAYFGTSLLFAPVLAMIPMQASAQVSYFVQIAGITGESTDVQHANWIDVLSMNTFPIGTAQPPSFDFAAYVSSASPALLLGAASGQQFATATVGVRRGAVGNPDYLKYTMTNVVVVSEQVSAAGGSPGVPLERVTLSYSTLQIQYRQQRPDGTYGPPITTCWDFVAGAPCST